MRNNSDQTHKTKRSVMRTCWYEHVRNKKTLPIVVQDEHEDMVFEIERMKELKNRTDARIWSLNACKDICLIHDTSNCTKSCAAASQQIATGRWCKQTSMCVTTCCLLLMNENWIKTDKVWYCEQRVEELENTTMTVSWERSPCMPAETSENWATYAKWKKDSNQKNSRHSTRHAKTISKRKVTVIVINRYAWRDHNDEWHGMWMLNETPNNEWRSSLGEGNHQQWMMIRLQKCDRRNKKVNTLKAGMQTDVELCIENGQRKWWEADG